MRLNRLYFTRATVFFLAAMFALFVYTPPAHARRDAVVKDIRYYSASGYTRVVLNLSRSTGYSINRLKNPERLYVDLVGASISSRKSGEIVIQDGLLRKIRPAQFNADTVRVVMDLKSMDSYKIFRLSDPPRIVVDVFGEDDKNESSRDIDDIRERVNNRIDDNKIDDRIHKEIRPFRVVIDAGHGGKDPGALGPGGIREKNVVLDIARRVRKILEAEKGYEVLLTRDRDIFLELEERTVVANQKSADLFVSIHANANRSRRLRGIETYFLNFTDDEAAIEVAARENKISVKKMKETRSEVGAMLASLALQNKRDESLELANYIQGAVVSQIARRYSRVVNHGVKKALFYVLFGARMPSVLVEVSYITNPSEARRLSSPTYRQHLAKGIAEGIKTFFAESTPDQKIAKR